MTGQARWWGQRAVAAAALGLMFVGGVALRDHLGTAATTRPAVAAGPVTVLQNGVPQTDAAARIAALHGTLTPLQSRTAPSVPLMDQRGAPVSVGQFRGKVVVLTTMDSRCTTVCPVVATEIAAADRQLGSLARHVVFVGFNVNPYFRTAADVMHFSQIHGLAPLPNWYFMTGSVHALHTMWKDYWVAVQANPTTQTVVHGDYLFFIGPGGHEHWLLGGSRHHGLSLSYEALIVQLVRTLWGHHGAAP